MTDFNSTLPPASTIIGIKGAGEMASAVAVSCFRANFKNIYLMETTTPTAVRRNVAFSEVLFNKTQVIEGVEAIFTLNKDEILKAWQHDQIAVITDPQWNIVPKIKTTIIVDAILAKNNLGTHKNESDLVIGLGPGFSAKKDVDIVIETNRGDTLGDIITVGEAQENTGIPGSICGCTAERVLRAPKSGQLVTQCNIGQKVCSGAIVGKIDDMKIPTQISGIIRGLLRSGTTVHRGTKIGDIDPRGKQDKCFKISSKAQTIGHSVVETIQRHLALKLF